METPLTIVIFGATGDLFQTKLVPALHELFVHKLLPEQFSVIGYGRREMSNGDFRTFAREALDKKFKTSQTHESFLSHIRYIQGELDNVEDVQKIGKADLFYIALPPKLSEVALRTIHTARIVDPSSRILIEKPFGQDQAHARLLDTLTKKLFTESQIFRVDHYLAKETVQNILDFRAHTNTEEKWNNQYIEKIKIYIHEKNTPKNRGAFYDSLGALKDVGQNHMLAMLASVVMEKPFDRTAKTMQDARRDVLSRISVNKNSIVRGQYKGYLMEAGVDPKSQTETFFRVTLSVDTEKWRGVVCELESGKALSQSKVAVEILFKDGNIKIFDISSPAKFDAYEKVFMAGIAGDQNYFVSSEEMAAAWKVVTIISNLWQFVPLVVYNEGENASKI